MTTGQPEPVHQTRWVRRGAHRIHARDYPGTDPTIVLLHGFPDDLHLYDLLIPALTGSGRRVVAFDFLGWGESDKPAGYSYTSRAQADDLGEVLGQLGIGRCMPVAHDSSGPPAIDWALAHPERISSWCCSTPTMRGPWGCAARRRSPCTPRPVCAPSPGPSRAATSDSTGGSICGRWAGS